MEEIDQARNEMQEFILETKQSLSNPDDDEYMDKEIVDDLANYEQDMEKAKTLVQRSKKQKVSRKTYLNFVWSFFYNQKQKKALIFNTFLLFTLTAFYIGNPVILKNLIDSMQITLNSPQFQTLSIKESGLGIWGWIKSFNSVGSKIAGGLSLTKFITGLGIFGLFNQISTLLYNWHNLRV